MLSAANLHLHEQKTLPKAISTTFHYLQQAKMLSKVPVKVTNFWWQLQSIGTRPQKSKTWVFSWTGPIRSISGQFSKNMHSLGAMFWYLTRIFPYFANLIFPKKMPKSTVEQLPHQFDLEIRSILFLYHWSQHMKWLGVSFRSIYFGSWICNHFLYIQVFVM